jgi:hypothetical protein
VVFASLSSPIGFRYIPKNTECCFSFEVAPV